MTSTYFGGRVTDRIGAKRALTLGWLLYAAIYAAFALATSRGALVAVFLAYGLYYGLVEPAERALVAKLAPARARGTAFGYFHFVVGAGALPASVLFGYLWTAFGSAAAFLAGAAFAAAGAALLAAGQGMRPKSAA
jgi:MFS family permease